MMNEKHVPRLEIFTLIFSVSGLVVIPACDIGPITPPAINQAPTANAGVDQNVEVGQRVLLSGLGSTDPDDDPLNYNWQQRSGPGIALDEENSAQASFLPVEDGFYEFALTVSDGRGGSDKATVRIFVGDVDPSTCPRADAGVDQMVNEGGVVTLRGGNSADPSGNPLSYEWFQLSGQQVSINGVFNVEPSFAAPQVTGADIVLEVELTVCNEQGCCDTDTVVITVRNRDPSDPCNDIVCEDDGLFCNGVEICVDGNCHEGEPPCGDELCDEDANECVPDLHVAVGLRLSYRGTVLENEITEIGGWKRGSIEGLRVRLPDGELLDVPEWSDPVLVGPSGFVIHLPGPPQINAPYLFEALDGSGNPIESFTCVAVYSGTRVDPPRGVQAVIDIDTLVLTWDPVNLTKGFNPILGVGGYSLELFGHDGLYYHEGTAEAQASITPAELEQLPPGTYTLVIFSQAVAPESSCDPERLVEDCNADDILEHVRIEIDEDGRIALVGGVCTDNADCNDGNACTMDECADGECVFTGVECSEGQVCNPFTGDCEAPRFSADLKIHLYGPGGTTPLEDRDPVFAFDVGTNIVMDTVRVMFPNGVFATTEPFTDVFSPDVDWITEFRFHLLVPALPIQGEPYTFIALDVAGKPIPGVESTDMWTGADAPDPPTSVQAELTAQGIRLSWETVSDVPGSFEPASGIGWYQIGMSAEVQGVYGANSIDIPEHIIPMALDDFVPGQDHGLPLSELEDGVYIIGVNVHSVAPEGSGGQGIEYSSQMPGEEITFNIVGGQVILP